MLKGCQRRIIMVKDTGSRYFDSAYFVIKSDLPSSAAESDMLTEAHRMISAYIPTSSKSSASLQAVETMQMQSGGKQHKRASLILAGVLLSLASVSLSVLIMLLFN